MFRVAYETHLSLSAIADRKAHLMLGVNMFLLSFVLTKKKLGVLSHVEGLLVPDILLVVFCLVCIVLAILATRPNLPPKPPSPQEAGFNWLFYGHFQYVDLQTFTDQLHRMSANPAELEAAMSSDLYGLGRSLERKYRYLHYCYTIFLIGLPILSCIFGYYLLMR